MSTTITEQKRRGRPKKVDDTALPTRVVEEAVESVSLSISAPPPPPPIDEVVAEVPADSTAPTEPYIHKTIPASLDHDPYAGIGGPLGERGKRRRGGGFWN